MLMRGENRKGSVHLSWDYAYAGPISKILRQIDEWMDEHPYEVLVSTSTAIFKLNTEKLL